MKMITLSQIATTVRQQGVKISQTRLLNGIKQYEPVFQSGRSKWYSDADAQEFIDIIVNAWREGQVVTRGKPNTPTQLDRIERKLDRILAELGVKGD